MAQKKIPERMCLGCQAMRPKKELIRIARSPEGVFSLDPTGKSPGRGAYLCRSFECFERARKAHRFERSFQAPVDPVVYEELARELLQEQGHG